jgi:hypothetical protein
MSHHPTSEQSKRLEALKAKHAAISERLDTAMKRPASADYYLVQLKKQKLLLKDSIQKLVRGHNAANQTESVA